MHQLGNIDKLHHRFLQTQFYNPNWFAGNAKYANLINRDTGVGFCVPVVVTSTSLLDDLDGVSDQLYYDFTVSLLISAIKNSADPNAFMPKPHDYFEIRGNRQGFADRYEIIESSTMSNEFELYFNTRYTEFDAALFMYATSSNHRLMLTSGQYLSL